MSDPSKVLTTHLYVIWIWQEKHTPPDGVPSWRAILQDPRSSQRWGFADVEAALTFLRTRVTEEKGGSVDVKRKT